MRASKNTHGAYDAQNESNEMDSAYARAFTKQGDACAFSSAILRTTDETFYDVIDPNQFGECWGFLREQTTLFKSPEPNPAGQPAKSPNTQRRLLQQASINGCFQIQNRRYLGNKHKLLDFIKDIIAEKCGDIASLCDIFAGTGVVGSHFNSAHIKIVSNDFLFSNYVCLKTFLGGHQPSINDLGDKIAHLNNLCGDRENYFSEHFGETYFTRENAMKIGEIRAEIEEIADNDHQRWFLICALLYAVDKVANTVGHYDAFRKHLDMVRPIKLLVPEVRHAHNTANEVHQMDANYLIEKISCDVLYLDPPYNSRQYSDAYHLLENLAEWKKPEVIGTARKMNRAHIKSNYCFKSATKAFADLIDKADCRHILLSYNNTGDSKGERSNARMRDNEILKILKRKGKVEVFERKYKAFTTGKSNGDDNAERVFYCRVRNSL